jgi:hypothetical protein
VSRAPADAATYVYAVLRSAKAPSARRVPPGLPAMGAVRFVDGGGGLWMVAADAPLPRYSAAAIESGLRDMDWVSACALGHERVVEHFAKSGPLIPLKMFTLFTTDARAAAHVTGNRARLDRVLDRIVGREEWGVRVSLDEKTAHEEARSRAASSTKGLSEGTRFLMARQREQAETKRVVQDARAAADAVYDALVKIGDDAVRRTPVAGKAGARLLLDAAFLVPTRRLRRFQEAAAKQARRLQPAGLSLVLTGPWPPYNFVAERA